MKHKILPYRTDLKEKARALRKDMTLSEVLMWNELKQGKMCGMDFDRQRPILNYIVDFYCKDLMLAIEIDGSSHDEIIEQDDKRQKEIEALGVNFLRYTDLAVKTDITNVLRNIEHWIENAIAKQEHSKH